MILEDQVTILELSKKLKELGIRQNSLYSWRLYKDWCVELSVNGEYFRESYSAFSSEEIMEILPVNIEIKNNKNLKLFNYRLHISKYCNIEKSDESGMFFESNYIVNYLNDTLNLKINSTKSMIWPISFNTLIDINIYNNKLVDALAEMLIYLIENNIWKPELNK